MNRTRWHLVIAGNNVYYTSSNSGEKPKHRKTYTKSKEVQLLSK